jgi:hypothetical protein
MLCIIILIITQILNASGWGFPALKMINISTIYIKNQVKLNPSNIKKDSNGQKTDTGNL